LCKLGITARIPAKSDALSKYRRETGFVIQSGRKGSKNSEIGAIYYLPAHKRRIKGNKRERVNKGWCGGVMVGGGGLAAEKKGVLFCTVPDEC